GVCAGERVDGDEVVRRGRSAGCGRRPDDGRRGRGSRGPLRSRGKGVDAMIVLGLAMDALAVSGTVCFHWNLAYDDGSVGDELKDTTTVARGVHVRFTDEDTPPFTETWYWADSSGCVVFSLSSGTDHYAVDAFAESKVGTNYVYVQTDTGGS